MLNVKEIGAKGNGKDDDTDVIQNAINKCNTVYLPAGEYVISNQLVLKANTTLIGDGANTKIICAPDSNNWVKQKDELQQKSQAMITNEFNNINYTPNITIKNLQLWGYKENSELKYKIDGIRLISTYHAIVENVKVAWVGLSGISIYGVEKESSTPEEPYVFHNTNYIKDCLIHENGEYGVVSDNKGHDFHIIGGDIGSNNNANIYLSSPNSSVSNVRAIWGSQNSAGIVIANLNTQVTNCNIDGNATYSIWVRENTKNAYIMGNKLYAASTDSGNGYGYASILVDDNVFNTAIIANQIMGRVISKEDKEKNIENYLAYCIYNNGEGTQILSNYTRVNDENNKSHIYSSKNYILSSSKNIEISKLS